MNPSFEEILMLNSIEKKPDSSCCHFLHDLLFKKREKSVQISNNSVKTPHVSYEEEAKNSRASTFLSENPKIAKNGKNCENPLNFFNSFSITEHPIEKYPINQLLSWESLDKKLQILVKITEKRFKYTKENRVISSENKKKRSFDRKIHDFIRIPSDYNQKIPIFEVIQHVTSRLKGVFLLDFSNGIGEYTIPLLKTSDFVVSFFRNPTNCGFTNENLTKNHFISLANLMYFTEEDFNFHGKFDVIFINPYTVFSDFCSKSLNSEETKGFLKKLMLKTQNFAMILNRNTQNIENLIELLSFLAQKQQKCGFEIEKIYYNDKLKFLYLYHGEIASISIEEELDYFKRIFLENTLEKQEFPMDYALKVNNLLFFLNRTVGNSTILHLIKNSLEKSKGNSLNIYEIFKKILKKSPFFKRSGSFLAHKSSIRVIKPSLFMANASPLQFFGNVDDSSIEEGTIPSEKSIDLEENHRESDEEYVLSDYSVDLSNDESNEIGNPRENDENEEFKIVQIMSETKLSSRRDRLSNPERKERKNVKKT